MIPQKSSVEKYTLYRENIALETEEGLKSYKQTPQLTKSVKIPKRESSKSF